MDQLAISAEHLAGYFSDLVIVLCVQLFFIYIM